MSLRDKIRENRRQYGTLGCTVRILHFLLRQFGIVWERFYYLEKELTSDTAKITNHTPHKVKELTFDDFRKGDASFFTDAKLSYIKNILADKTYVPYGIIIDGKLAYSAWISLKRLPLPYGFELTLNDHEGALLDDYCMPEFRRQGLHSEVLKYRLKQLYIQNKKQSVVVILTSNRPALKAEMKAGFKTVKKFTILKIFNKKKMIWK